MALYRMQEWLQRTLLGDPDEPRTEILSGRILPEGATLIAHRIAREEIGRLTDGERADFDRQMSYLVRNPALNDGPASHHKCPVVHKYIDDRLYCYIWGMSRMILEKFAHLLDPPDRQALRAAGDFSVLLLRVITLPDPREVVEAMDLVPPECRDVMRMRFERNMTPDAISDELKSTPTVIRRMLVRGLEAIADQHNEFSPVPLDGWRLD